MTWDNVDADADGVNRAKLIARAEGHGRIFQALGDLFVSEVHHHYSGVPASNVISAPVVIEQITGRAQTGEFVGRENEQVGLLQALEPSSAGPATTIVSAVSGMAGVGKTALVRRVAAAAVSEEWFSGGAFFLDFRGYDAIPIEPGDVLRPLLNALGIPIDQIPLDVASQSAVFHRVLSERARTGMNVLLILDNVSASDQIAGLIPGPPNRALVTSRHLLADIEGVRILNLEVLDDHQAVGLMREALRRQNSADTRIESEPEQAHQLAQLCGGLPLALRIAAALLAEDSSFTIASLVERLSNVSDRLKELKYGDNWAVRRAFDSSYGHLGAEQSHMFRLLALNPGPHISVGAAAVLANVPEHVARQLLAGLHRAHLVELGPNFGTYRLHDLLSIYAAEECQASETVDRRTEALGRLFEYYLVASRSAISHLDPVTTAPPSGTFVDRSSALVWLEAERPNLTASIALAADVGEMPHARDLSLCLSPFFDLRKHWADWTSTHQLALAATRHLGDRAGEASVLNSIGRAYRELRRFDEAVTHLELALAIFGELGDPHGQGVAFNNMGNTYGELGQFDVAIQYYRRAGELFSQLGDRHMEGRIFNNMGNDYAKLGRHQDALDYHLRALTIFKDTENSYGEAHVLDSLGNDYADLRDFDNAIRVHLGALRIFQDIGERYGIGRALVNLTMAHAEIGQMDAAVEYGRQALEIFQEVGDRYGEGMALMNVGMVHTRTGQISQAESDYREASRAFEDASAPENAEVARSLLADLGLDPVDKCHP